MWSVLENVLDLGGATVGQIRSLMASIFSLEEKGRKYKLSEDQHPGRTHILGILDKVEKANPNDANRFVLRPIRRTEVAADENEQDFIDRMMTVDLNQADEDTDDWVKVYATYVKHKAEGNIHEFQLDVS
jgi:hypothetical protein